MKSERPMAETSPNHRDSGGDESSASVQLNTNPTSNNTASEKPQESGCDNLNTKSSDALAKALSSMLSTVIKDFDSKAQITLQSQDQLSYSIDRLTRELDQLLEDAPMPFIMQYASKISGVRKRVSSLNSVLKSIQQRVDNIDRMLAVDLLREKEATESSLQH